jgi:hypothetical protein
VEATLRLRVTQKKHPNRQLYSGFINPEHNADSLAEIFFDTFTGRTGKGLTQR